MGSTKKTILIIVSSIIILLTISVILMWIYISGWPPFVIRNQQYHTLISAFNNTKVIEPTEENGDWNFNVQISDNNSVNVDAHTNSNVVIKYEDEKLDRELYKYLDYTTTKDIRITGKVLYVYWFDNLFRKNHWILSYDLNERYIIIKLRIDPKDLK